MLGRTNENTNLSVTTMAMAVGKKAVAVGAGYIAIDGKAYGPTSASDVSLVGVTVETGYHAIVDIYADTSLAFSVVKDKEYANSTSYEFALDTIKTKSVKDYAQWTSGVTYSATNGDIVIHEMNYYLALSNHTAGASFDTTKWTQIITPDATPKAHVGKVIIKNATGSQFVGGTTDLDTASLTVVYLPSTPVTLQ